MALIQYVNKAFERVTGYSRHEAIGQTPVILKSNRHDDAFYDDLLKTIKKGQSWSGRLMNRRKDGVILTEDSSVTPLFGKSGELEGFVSVNRDVTRQVQMEETLRQSQRTEAIGKLAGGIAHDFNNILQVIKSNVSFARESDVTPEDLKDFLEQIDAAGSRASTLTRQLLAFSRRQSLQFILLDPAQVVADVIKLIRRLIGEHIQIDYSAQPDLDVVKADVGQLEQVVLNLCVNARDSMPVGGTLSLKLRNVQISEAERDAFGSGIEKGSYVEISVTDTGLGMDEATLSRIFEPFFTTKAVGKGTGLGLSMVQGIVQQHGGHIFVESQLGKGSTFRILLPATKSGETHMATAAAGEKVDSDAFRGSGTLLLAEDDMGVRRTAVTLLERSGYQVLQAADGEEACHLAELHPGEISVAVLDLVMPKLSGFEAAKRLKLMRPGIRIIICSGYTAGVSEKEIEDESWTLVRKPYAGAELLKALRTVLEG